MSAATINSTTIAPSRRGFLAGTSAVAAGALISHRAVSALDNHGGKVVDTQSFASLKEIGDGVWAVLSTPLNAQGGFEATTLSNGGLIMGDDKVVAFDAYFQPAGAAWLAEHAKKLTGRYPTHVIVSHLHADHCGGLAGFQHGAEGPEIIMTEATRQLIFDTYGRGAPRDGQPFGRPPIRLVGPTQIIHDESKATKLDLGGRTLTIDPLAGHTPSDLAVHVDDQPIIFGSDLVWDGFFPNYVNAVPSKILSSAKKLFQDGEKLVVSGHGGYGKAKDMGTYIELIEAIDAGAQAAHAAGMSVEEGVKAFNPPKASNDWIKFNQRYPEIAYGAWYRELDNAG